MAEKKGQYYTLKYEGTALGAITNISMQIGAKEINISSFDSGQFEEFLQGRKNVTMTVTCMRDDADTSGQGTLVDELITGDQSGAIVFGPGTPAAGDISYSGSGFVTNASVESPDDEAATASYDLRISGVLTKSTAT